MTAEQDGEWVRETVERLTGQREIWVKPDLEDEDPGFEVIQGRDLKTFWVSQEWAKKRDEAELWGFLLQNGWPVGQSLKLTPGEIREAVEQLKVDTPPVRTNDAERDARIWEEGFQAAVEQAQQLLLEEVVGLRDVRYIKPEQNPYQAPQEAQGKLLEALQDRDALLGALGPYALQMACSNAPDVPDAPDCGKCHNCRARALYSPIIKWIRKGYRRTTPPST